MPISPYQTRKCFHQAFLVKCRAPCPRKHWTVEILSFQHYLPPRTRSCDRYNRSRLLARVHQASKRDLHRGQAFYYRQSQSLPGSICRQSKCFLVSNHGALCSLNACTRALPRFELHRTERVHVGACESVSADLPAIQKDSTQVKSTGFHRLKRIHGTLRRFCDLIAHC